MLGTYHSGRVNTVVLIHIYFHFLPYRVPNIKFNVAKVLESIFPIVDQSVSIILVFSILCSSLLDCLSSTLTANILAIQVVEKTIRPCLVELSEDPDVDVRFFSNQALQAIDHVMMSS